MEWCKDPPACCFCAAISIDPRQFWKHVVAVDDNIDDNDDDDTADMQWLNGMLPTDVPSIFICSRFLHLWID